MSTYINNNSLPKGDWDFIGFRYGDFSLFEMLDDDYQTLEKFNQCMPHSSGLNIKRVTNGLLGENATPDFTDITTKVTGSNETYYFGSDYTQRQITVNFAFDSLTQTDFISLQKEFVSENPKNLIFDECPYKMYTVKLASPMQLNYICFDELINGEEHRIYKGDGTINFVAYYPFARSPFNTLNEFREKMGYDITNDWVLGCGIDQSQECAFIGVVAGALAVNVKSIGTRKSHFTIEINKQFSNNELITISIGTLKKLTFYADSSINKYIINMKNHLIYDGNNNILNKKISSGDFFYMEPTDVVSNVIPLLIRSHSETTISSNDIVLKYSCLYN